jgi:DNA-binding GntR family transcriptional regulator
LNTVRPIRREPNRLVDEVHQRILEMISNGELGPDSRVRQERLAEDLGVSRTPIREALLRLEREGILYSKAGGGMTVKPIRPRDVSEIYEVRVILEPYAARLACERATAKDIERVRGIQRRHERRYPREIAVAFRSNLELHTGMCGACGNDLLLRLLENIWHQDAALRVFAFYSQDLDTVNRMIAEHRRIVDAFARRDAARVDQLLRHHIDEAHLGLLDRLEEMRTGDSEEVAT